nr:hypothetical protein GCM10020185_09300 [Pseudomonas brassicacearum subsp. brassicacearum]
MVVCFYPEGGWVHPPALCRWQASGPAIDVQPHHEVLQLRRVDGHWQAWDGERCLASAPVAILASAAEIKRFEAAADLPLKRIRGQITRLPQTTRSQSLATVVCAEGYAAPPRLGEHTLGASFDFNSDDLTPTAAEHAGNLQMLEEISLDLVDRLNAGSLDPERLEGRAAFRCTSPDYLPIVGPLADRQAFTEAYAALGKDARQVPDAPLPVARWPVHQQRPRFPRPDHRPAVGRTDRRLAGQRTPATAPQRGRSLPSKPVCVASIDSGQGLTQMDGSPQILWELSLLAMAMCQPTWMPTDPPPSRASSAPTGSPIFEIPWQTIPHGPAYNASI